MAEQIIMPKLGFNMDEGQLVKWHKAEGDVVKKGELLFEINTDKTTMPVEATADGTMLKILLEEGAFADVFTPIAIIGEPGESLDDMGATSAASAQTPVSEVEKTATYDYDVVVIGAGPGGYEAAIKAGQCGLKTCVIEAKHFGGTCLNVGCIPTKALIKCADVVDMIHEADAYAIEGIDKAQIKVNMTKLQQRKATVVSTLVNGVKGLLRANKVTAVEGHASFVDPHTVAVGDKQITASNFIIATGSSVFIPPFIAQEGENNILTSTQALDLDYVPKEFVIIGGGVIGIEFAYLMNKLGSKVIVLELMEHILPMVDAEVADRAEKRLAQEGVVFHLGAKVEKVKDNVVYYTINGQENTITGDAILMAVGRVANSEGLNAQAIGLEYDKRNLVADDHLRTNIPHIYAIGDVNGKVMLAHTSSHEGMVAVANICGHDEAMDYRYIPSCIYMKPEISCVGISEAAAKEQYSNVKVGRFDMMANGKSVVEGDTDGLFKVILDGDTGEILGVHLYGHHVTDMMGELAVAMTGELTAEEFLLAIHPHPSFNEALGEAFMKAWTGKAINSL